MKSAVPVSYGFTISLFGMLGLPSSIFVIALMFDNNAWELAIRTTGFQGIFFIFAVVHLVVSLWLITKGLILIKNTDENANF